MALTYKKTVWKAGRSGGTAWTPDRLNNIENGIEQVTNHANSADSVLDRIWFGSVSGVNNTTGQNIKDKNGDNITTANPCKLRVDCITNTNSANSASSYLVDVNSTSDTSWVTPIFEGETARAPIVYISAEGGNLKIRLNTHTSNLTVYYTVTKIQ